MERHSHYANLSLIPLFVLIMVSAFPAGAQTAPGAILEKFRQSVFTVNAYCRQTREGDGKNIPQGASPWRRNVGTAFPIGDQGYLVTLNCVIRAAQKVQVMDADGKKYEAAVVGFDDEERISVLKIRPRAPFPVPVVRSMESVKPGGRVILLGAPPGESLCAISGNVSAVNDPDGAVVVTVAGDPGTSGTPVFDEQGKVIGLLAYHLERDDPSEDTLIHSYLVLPMEYAALLAQTIINRHESRNGWLGISTALSGLTVVEVAKGSPAEKSGIKPGDQILGLNDSTVGTPEDLVRVMGSTRPGDTVRIRVRRGSETISLTSKLLAHPGIALRKE